MTVAEAGAFWLTTALYVAAFVGMVAGAVLRRETWGRAALVCAGTGLAANTVLVGVHWAAVGHLPVGDRYELNISGVWIAMALILAVAYTRPRMRSLAAGALPAVILVLGLAITSQKRTGPLSPAYDSPWLVVHIVFAFLAFGCFALAFGAGVLYLLEDRGVRHRFSDALPELEELDVFGYRMVALGFILEALMIVTGAVWANNLWGSYWSWDPVETWSLISLLVYALYLHLYSFKGWRGRRAAILAVVGLVFVIICFWGVQFFVPTVHNFNRF